MKVCTVVGARPQFIKAAVVSSTLRRNHQEILIHTGQHFDYQMSGKFFDELDMPMPDYNLGIAGGTHAQMTGRMLIVIEEVLMKECPDWLLVYGDTNSTLAAVLAAAKIHIPICHVEAGVRAHSRTNPEEMNRICADHLSELLLVSTESGMKEVEHEGLEERARLVGDPMYDAFINYTGKIAKEEIKLNTLQGEMIDVPKEHYYLTCHREENTNDEKMNEIFKAMDGLDAKTIYPVHPRNKKRAWKIAKQLNARNILLCEPVGYLESLFLVKNAKKIVTDSGGLQREAFFAEKKCVSILPFAVWPETMVSGRNTLASPNAEDIRKKLSEKQEIDETYKPFGDGKAGERIVVELEEHS